MGEIHNVIAAMPRGASSFIHRLLRCTGIEAGHESVYRMEGWTGVPWPTVEVTPWMPFDEAPARKILLQIRHPLRVIGSLAETQVIPGINNWRSAEGYYLTFYNTWSEHAANIYCIEDIYDPHSYKANILRPFFPDREWISDHLAAALHYVPFDYNSRPHSTPEWSDVSKEIQDIGLKHGYLA